MRINLNQATQPLPESQATGSAEKNGATAAQGFASTLGEDQAQLSGIHLQVQALVAHVLQLPEAANEKVQALRQAVTSGKYRPNVEQVAGALFSSLIEKVAA